MNIIELIKKSWKQMERSKTTAWTIAGIYFLTILLELVLKEPNGIMFLLSALVNILWSYWFMRYLVLTSSGKKITVGTVFNGAWLEFGRLVGLEAMVLVLVFVPMVLGIMSGSMFWYAQNYIGFGVVLFLGLAFVLALIWLSLRLGFAYYLIFDEKIGLRKALSRSMEITKGKVRKILGLILQYVLLLIPLFIFAFVMGLCGLEKLPVYSIGQSLLSMAYGLFGGLVWVNFYRELKK